MTFQSYAGRFWGHHTKRKIMKGVREGVAVWRCRVYSQGKYTCQFPSYHLSLAVQCRVWTPHGLLVTGSEREIRNDVKLFPLTALTQMETSLTILSALVPSLKPLTIIMTGLKLFISSQFPDGFLQHYINVLRPTMSLCVCPWRRLPHAKCST